jgi:hypothetical protein
LPISELMPYQTICNLYNNYHEHKFIKYFWNLAYSNDSVASEWQVSGHQVQLVRANDQLSPIPVIYYSQCLLHNEIKKQYKKHISQSRYSEIHKHNGFETYCRNPQPMRIQFILHFYFHALLNPVSWCESILKQYKFSHFNCYILWS